MLRQQPESEMDSPVQREFPHKTPQPGFVVAYTSGITPQGHAFPSKQIHGYNKVVVAH
jgi:hypothetical protein